MRTRTRLRYAEEYIHALEGMLHNRRRLNEMYVDKNAALGREVESLRAHVRDLQAEVRRLKQGSDG